MKNLFNKSVLIFILFMLIAGGGAGCSAKKVDNSDNFEALKAYLANNYQSLKINSMAESFAGLLTDTEEQKKLIESAKAGYEKINVKNIYLVSGPTFESNETIFGSLVHFKKAMTIEAAKESLKKEENFKNQPMDLLINGNFAFVSAVKNGKMSAPESLIKAFKNFK